MTVSVTAVDQRLASRMHQGQVDVLERSERLARMVGRVYGRLLQDLAALAASDDPPETLLRRAEQRAEAVYQRARSITEDGLVRMAAWSYRRATDRFLETIPLGWFRLLDPIRLAELPEADEPDAGPELDQDDPYGPVRRREMDRDEAMELIRSLLFESPSPKDVERWLTEPVGDGKTWDERLKSWDQQARDKMLPQIVQSVSAGESMRDLRERLQPIVNGPRYKAERIARTEGRRVAERAQLRAAEQLGDMLGGMQWMAVLDQWTRSDHAALHGKVYQRQSDGTYRADDGQSMPDVPLGPNCRCMVSPVLVPPEEFASDPALRARFQNASGDLIPDPAAYNRWFDRASEAQRKTAIGVRRYNAAKARLGREPEWQDLIDRDGNLLSVGRIRRETPAERAERRQQVDAMLLRREALYKEASRHGFVRPTRYLPPGERPIVAGRGLPNLDTPEKLEMYLRGKEREIAGAEPGSAEWAVVLDRNGDEIFRQRGDQRQVEFTDDQLDKMRGQILTHVHPPSPPLHDQPPSTDDALLLADAGLQELRVVTEKYHFKLESPEPEKAKGLVVGWKDSFRHQRTQTRRSLQNRVDQGKLSQEEADAEWQASEPEDQHKAWQDTARQFGFSYQRSRRNA